MLRQVLSYCSSAQSQLHDLGKLGGWPAEECRRMVIAYPSLLGMNVRRNVAPKFYYLQVRPALSRYAGRGRRPAIRAHSCDAWSDRITACSVAWRCLRIWPPSGQVTSATRSKSAS